MWTPEEFERQKKIIQEKNLVNKKSTADYSELEYSIPVSADKIIKVTLKSSAHVGNLCNAIDFYVPDGTEVYAAADGAVVAVRDSSNQGGTDSKYWYSGNYVLIKHNGEYTHYEHLQFKGVVVKVGEKIKRGQLIGYKGRTGYTFQPPEDSDLHFEVQKYFGKGENDYVTLKARFKNFRDVYKE